MRVFSFLYRHIFILKSFYHSLYTCILANHHVNFMTLFIFLSYKLFFVKARALAQFSLVYLSLEHQ